MSNTFYTIDDYKQYAKARMPHFAWEYLDSGTGLEQAVARNEQALQALRLTPKIIQGRLAPDISTNFLGHDFARPFGIAPIGMASMMWPSAEKLLAQAAVQYNIPFSLSTVAGDSIENIGPYLANNPFHGWYQLYPPKNQDICKDIMKRAQDNNFNTLVLTVDVPYQSVRERQKKAGLTIPPKISVGNIMQACMRPKWCINVLRYGMPRFLNVEHYAASTSMKDVVQLIGDDLRGDLDMEYLQKIKNMWPGKFIVKGVLRPSDALALQEIGVDALWVSNHGGRQFDAVQAAIDYLPQIRASVGPKMPLIFDSGVRSGLDIVKALSLGANFVMLGRPFIYAATTNKVAKIGNMIAMLENDVKNNMIQCGYNSIAQIT